MSQPKINTNLYSRQIGTYGLEAMGKLITMKILIIGAKGNAIELAKDIVLAGPAQVGLYDPNLPSVQEQAANFFLRNEHIGKIPRAEAMVPLLRELNPYVKVVNENAKSIKEVVTEYNVVIVAELILKPSAIFEINQICRTHNPVIGFIVTFTLGLAGMVFVDYGNKYKVIDKDGEEPKSYAVVSITNEAPGMVFVDDSRMQEFENEELVKFKNIEGMTELNELKPLPIKRCDKYTFSICDTTKFSKYIRGGTVESVKTPIVMTFKPFEEAMKYPLAEGECFIEMETRKIGVVTQLHLAFRVLMEFYERKGSIPRINSIEDSNEFITIAKEVNEKSKSLKEHCVDTVDENLMRNYSLGAAAQLTMQCCFYGAIAAQEAVKFTGLYLPLKQFFHYECFESLPKTPITKTLHNTRYDDYIAIYGDKLVSQWRKAYVFMVGAGALGCELIKAFALMGYCTEGSLLVTDMDTIELSNLNRQFLFRFNNIGHLKAECAVNAAKLINNEAHYQFDNKKVCEEEEKYDDQFWMKQDLVISAVDNIKARQYIDQKCVWFYKPFLESGTLGTKCHSSAILPRKTQCYSDIQDPPEKEFAMCTIRNFPNIIEHCIEWGRNKFEGDFTANPTNLINFLDNREDFVNGLKKSTTSTGLLKILNEIYETASLIGKTFDCCVEKAILTFTDYFTFEIMTLLHCFPQDYKDKDNQLYWSGAKRPPEPIHLDISKNLHMQFIKSCSILLAKTVGVLIPPNIDEIIGNKVKAFKMPVFVPTKSKIKLDDDNKAKDEMQPMQIDTPENEQELKDTDEIIKKLIEASKKINPADIKPEAFEKDDDTNYHVEFINAVTNIRAANYKIKECDFEKTKRIAGKIVPAIATSTALIVGCVLNESLKVLQVNM